MRRSMSQLKSEALSWTKSNNVVVVVVLTLKCFEPSSSSEALTKAARSFGYLRFQLVAKSSVIDVCFFTSGGDHPKDIIELAICNILTFPVGVVVELAEGIVQAPLDELIRMVFIVRDAAC